MFIDYPENFLPACLFCPACLMFFQNFSTCTSIWYTRVLRICTLFSGQSLLKSPKNDICTGFVLLACVPHCLDLDLNVKRPGISSDGNFTSYTGGQNVWVDSEHLTSMIMPHPRPFSSMLLRTFFKSHNFFIMEK